MEKGRGSAVALAFALRDLIEANAILLRAVEIRIALHAGFFARRDKRFR